MNKKMILGHSLGIFTALVWGTTLISTKILLKDFQPVEILFSRFLIAVLVLNIIFREKSPKTTPKQELILILAGLFGICLYYLLENTALIYTIAANVGVINCLAPMFTAIIVTIFLKTKEKMSLNFIIGFLLSISGVSLIAYNGVNLELNPLGDFLAVLAATCWAIYSVLIKTLFKYGFSTIFITKRTFIYGTLLMIPFLFFFDFHLNFGNFLKPINLFNILFLGILASAICFATWSKAIKILGAIKSGAYIYLIPVITIVTSVVVLKEPVNLLLIIGTVLTLSGLMISELKNKKV